jgi:transcriptional regulator with XRE-family HTH domain
MDITKKFGQRIKQIRLSKKLSQGKLAKKLNVGAAYISKIERGTENISLRGMEKLAKALTVNIDQLLK